MIRTLGRRVARMEAERGLRPMRMPPANLTAYRDQELAELKRLAAAGPAAHAADQAAPAGSAGAAGPRSR